MKRIDILKTKIAIKLAGYDFTKPYKPVDYTGRAIILGDIELLPKQGLIQHSINFEGIHGYLISNDRDKSIIIRFYEKKNTEVTKKRS